MNVFHLNCRNVRMLAFFLIIVVSLYVALNVIYIVVFETVPISSSVVELSPVVDAIPPLNPNSSIKEMQSITGHLKFGKPDEHGKVEVVVSLDFKELAQLLGDSQLQGLSRKTVESQAGPMLPPNPSYVLRDPSVCTGLGLPTVQWMVAVNSAPENVGRRSLLRETWANMGLFQNNMFRTVFMLGRSKDVDEEAAVHAEFEKYRDVVQGDFVDVARNATLKGIMSLRLFFECASHAKYYVKTNDDTFLDIFEMMRLMESTAVHRLSVICPLWKDNTMPILRDPNDCMQWCVAENELPGRTHFPQYCAGLAFIVSRELALELYQASLSTPFFWIDDVYITGLLMANTSIKRQDIHFVDLIDKFSLVEEDIEKEYADTSKPIKNVIAKIHNVARFRNVWRMLIKRLPASQFKLLSNVAISQLDIHV